MSNSKPLESQKRDAILKAYSKGWEEMLVQAGIDALHGASEILPTVKSKSQTYSSDNLIKPESKVSGVVSINVGETIGRIVVIFSDTALLKLASIAYEEPITQMSKRVLDCAGEVTNMVYGFFKRMTSLKGLDLNLSVPSVAIGEYDVRSWSAGKQFFVDYDLSGASVTIAMIVDFDVKVEPN